MAKSVGTQDRELRKRRMAVAAALLAFAGIVGVLALLFGRDALAFLTDGHRVQQQVERLGPLAPVVFGLLVVLQEVTVIVPSEPLELAAGYAFGFWEGTLLCLVASAIGTALVMALVRQFGMRIVSLFFPPEKTTSLRWLQNARRFELVLFLVFLVPGTPKDLLTYVAGLGTSSLPRIVAITTVGRIPSIVSSTLAAGAFGDGNYLGAAVVAAVTLALAGAGIVAYRRIAARENACGEEAASSSIHGY